VVGAGLKVAAAVSEGGAGGGVGRTASGKTPTEILFVQGGDRNIDPAKYGAKTLHLPKGQTIAYDGSKFEGEAGLVAAPPRRPRLHGNDGSFKVC